MIKIFPSILSADLLKLEEQIRIVEENGADSIHVDIMDGHFVPNITFGPVIVSSLKKITKLPLDVHLMIMNPDKYIDQFVKAGADNLTVHQEMNSHLHRTINYIKEKNCQVGVCVNPATSISTIEPVLSYVDLVLIMTVNPGFGGQKFIHQTLDKIKGLSQLQKDKNYRFLIEVDGGINEETIPLVVKAGAQILVAGHAIFGQKDIAAAYHKLKKIAGS